jgi:hypothetical protein
MKWTLLLRDLDNVCAYDSYFLQKQDAFGNIGLSSIKKCTNILDILGYIIIIDVLDEYYQMWESAIMETMKRFVKAIQFSFEN